MLTTQKVHAMLRQAGLKKTTTRTTRIRGWSERSSGYQVREDDGHIYVSHREGGSWMISAQEIDRRQEKELDRYRAALAGFAPEIADVSPWGKCVVLSK